LIAVGTVYSPLRWDYTAFVALEAVPHAARGGITMLSANARTVQGIIQCTAVSLIGR